MPIDYKDIILQDDAIAGQISLLRFTSGEQERVLAVLTQLQKDLRVKLLGDLTDFGRARVNKLLREATEVVDSAYKEIASQAIRVLDLTPGNLTINELAKIYPSIPRKILNQIDSITIDPKIAGMGKFIPGRGLNIQTNQAALLHEIGHAVDNVLTDLQAERWIKIAKTELKFGILGNKPARLAGSSYSIWENLYTGFSIHHRSVAGEKLLASEIASIEKNPRTFKFIESILSKKVKYPTTTDLTGLAKQQATAVQKSFVAIGLDASLPTEAALKALVNGSLIEGAPSAAWWAKQNDNTAFAFAAQVRQGVAGNETVQQIVRRIIGSKRLGTVGIMETSRRGATALVHTSIQQVANDARLATFKANDDIVKGVMQLSTLDSHVTKICIAYANQAWDLDGFPIAPTILPFNAGTPRHWNCRSVLTAITRTYKELGIDIPEAPPGTRASDLGQIPATTTFGSFLDRHDSAYMDKLLGPGRARLYRDGKITLTQLVDFSGRPLTLKELGAL